MVGKEMLSLNLNFLGVTTVKKIILPFDEFSFLVGYTFYGAFGMSLKVIIFCIGWDQFFVLCYYNMYTAYLVCYS